MDYKQLKSGIKEISEIASSVPEQFREKCFETLLNALLAGDKQPPQEHHDHTNGAAKQDGQSKNSSASSTVTMNSQLRVLTRKTGLTEDELNKVVLVQDGEVNFIHEPHPTKVREGQLEWSLLIALKNAILKNALEADAEDIRSKCIDAGFYDRNNFAATFKSPKFKAYFKGTLKAQGNAVALSPRGQEALGDLIRRLAGEAK
jgi:hypothetical protein